MNNFIKQNWFKIIIVVASLVVVMAIGYYFIYLPKQQGQDSESLFNKQEQCASNRENAQRQLEETYKLATPYFYDIFYSQKTKTCVYTYGLLLAGESPNEIGSFVIADYFTGKQLFSVDYDNSSGDDSKYSYTVRPLFSEIVESYNK